MHITKWKIHILYDSKFMTSWKKQKFEDIKKKISDWDFPCGPGVKTPCS